MQDQTRASNTFKFRCNDCSQKLRVERTCSGKWMICPACESILEIPFVKVAKPVNYDQSEIAMVPAEVYDDLDSVPLQSLEAVPDLPETVMDDTSVANDDTGVITKPLKKIVSKKSKISSKTPSTKPPIVIKVKAPAKRFKKNNR